MIPLPVQGALVVKLTIVGGFPLLRIKKSTVVIVEIGRVGRQKMSEENTSDRMAQGVFFDLLQNRSCGQDAACDGPPPAE